MEYEETEQRLMDAGFDVFDSHGDHLYARYSDDGSYIEVRAYEDDYHVSSSDDVDVDEFVEEGIERILDGEDVPIDIEDMVGEPEIYEGLRDFDPTGFEDFYKGRGVLTNGHPKL